MQNLQRINLYWLVRLRYLAVAGQLLILVLSTSLFALNVPIGPLLTVTLLTLVTNIAAARADVSRDDSFLLTGLLTLDVLSLTGFLYFSGGASNPFSIFYLVHIALAAVTLRSRWVWALAVLSIACFGALFLLSPGHGGQHHAADHFSAHLKGMWVAFGLAAVSVAYLVSGLVHEVEKGRIENHRHARLLSLATLAAGAAHELNTPLSTIALITKELQHDLESEAEKNGDYLDDIQLIRSQVERCKAIIAQMSVGEEAVQPVLQPLHWQDLHQTICHRLGPERSHRLQWDVTQIPCAQITSVKKLEQVLLNLLGNALDANPHGAQVKLKSQILPGRLRFTVEDEGCGMEKHILERAGEPFFSTKEPGKGMGLGIFLTQNLVDQMGGKFSLHSQKGFGTKAVVEIPTDGTPA